MSAASDPVQKATDAADEAASDDKQGRRSARVVLMDIGKRSAEFIRDGAGDIYAVVKDGGPRRVWPLRSRAFRRHLLRRAMAEMGAPPGSDALAAALDGLEATADTEAERAEVHQRIAHCDGRIFVDLGDDAWRAVEISPAGWRILETPPVYFVRRQGMRTLPEPARGGDLGELFEHLPAGLDGRSRKLVAGWLIQAFWRGPYAALLVEGEAGAGKSTLCRRLVRLVDPRKPELKRPPRHETQIFVQAAHGHVLAYDNLSGLPVWLSDTLCAVATGGGDERRRLYTDDDVVAADVCRPLLLNGIDSIASRGDLRDRALRVELAAIPDVVRRDQTGLDVAFEAALPRLLGAVFDALAEGLRNHATVRLDRLPRMADAARFVAACEPTLRPELHGFVDAVFELRDSYASEAVESDAFAREIVGLMRERDTWNGTAGELLAPLNTRVTEDVRERKTWPQTPRAASGRLRRIAGDLRRLAEGAIEVEFVREGHDRRRTISLRAAPEVGESSSTTSAPSAYRPH